MVMTFNQDSFAIRFITAILPICCSFANLFFIYQFSISKLKSSSPIPKTNHLVENKNGASKS